MAPNLFDDEGRLRNADEYNASLGETEEEASRLITSWVNDNFQWGYGAAGAAFRTAENIDAFAKVTDWAAKMSEHGIRCKLKQLCAAEGKQLIRFKLDIVHLKTDIKGVVEEDADGPKSYLVRMMPAPGTAESAYVAVAGAGGAAQAYQYAPPRRDNALKARHRAFFSGDAYYAPTSGSFRHADAFALGAFGIPTDSDGAVTHMVLIWASTIETLPEPLHRLFRPLCLDAETYDRTRRILNWLSKIENAGNLKRQVDAEAGGLDAAADQAYQADVLTHQAAVSSKLQWIGQSQSHTCMSVLQLALPDWTVPQPPAPPAPGLGQAAPAAVDPEAEAQGLLRRIMTLGRSGMGCAGGLDFTDGNKRRKGGFKFNGKDINKIGVRQCREHLRMFAQNGDGEIQAVRARLCQLIVLARAVCTGKGRAKSDKEKQLAELRRRGFGPELSYEGLPDHLPRLQGVMIVPELWHATFAPLGKLTIGSKGSKGSQERAMAPKRIVWHVFTQPFLEKKFAGSRRLEAETRHSRQAMGMDFADMFAFVGMRREAWLSIRDEMIGKYPPRGSRTPDLELIFTLLDDIEPIVLDFIPTMKYGAEAEVRKHLREMVRVLSMLGCHHYSRILTCFINDLRHLESTSPHAYKVFMNSFCRQVGVYIEEQHKLLTGTSPQNVRGSVESTDLAVRNLKHHARAWQHMLEYGIHMRKGYHTPNVQDRARRADVDHFVEVIREQMETASAGNSTLPDIDNDSDVPVVQQKLSWKVDQSAFTVEVGGGDDDDDDDAAAAVESIQYEARILLSVGGTKEAMDYILEGIHRRNENALLSPAKEPQPVEQGGGGGGGGDDDDDDDDEREDGGDDDDDEDEDVDGHIVPVFSDSDDDGDAGDDDEDTDFGDDDEEEEEEDDEEAAAGLVGGRPSPKKLLEYWGYNNRAAPEVKGGWDVRQVAEAVDELLGAGSSWWLTQQEQEDGGDGDDDDGQ